MKRFRFLILAVILLSLASSWRVVNGSPPVSTRQGDIKEIADTLWIHFAQPLELLSDEGDDEVTQRVREQLGRGEFMPLALTSADLNQDGVPEMVSAYARQDGGVLTLHWGSSATYRASL